MISVDQGYNVKKILQHFGIPVKFESDRNIQTLCLWHNERRSSLGIEKSTGLFNCFACHKKGNIHMLVAELLKTSDRVAIESFLQNFVSSDVPQSNDSEITPELPPSMPVKDFSLFNSRLISPEVISACGVRANDDGIVFPIVQHGEYRGYIQRLFDGYTKFYIPKGFKIRNYMYNWDVVEHHGFKTIFLTEGVFDSLSLISRGLKNTLCVFSNQYPTSTQIGKLMYLNPSEIILCFDYDNEKSAYMIKKICYQLKQKLNTSVSRLLLPIKRDVDVISTPELKHYIETREFV